MTQIIVKRGLDSARTGITPAIGELIYTTDTKELYIGDGSTAGGTAVTSQGGAGANNIIIEHFTSNGVLTDFTTAASIVTPAAILVMIDGLVQYLDESYTISGNIISFSAAPVTSYADNIQVMFLGLALDIGTPAIGSVTPTHLSTPLNNTIDAAHINKEITYLNSSAYNSAFMLIDGKLYTASGNSATNDNRTTGRGGDNKTSVIGCDNFKEVSMPSSSPIDKVGCNNGYGVAWALLENGELYTWGQNSNGECGLGHTTAVTIPTLAATGVTDVYDHPSNSSYSIINPRLYIKKSDGYIYGAGYNGFGALGVGNTTNQTSFTQITSLGTNVIGFWNMGCTYGSAVAQKSDHTIWAAGYGGRGVLGNGSTTTVNSTFIDITSAWGGSSGYVLKQVIGLYGYYTTAGNSDASMGMLLDNGTTTIFRMSGDGTAGQLGNGANTDSSTPVVPNVGNGRISKMAIVGSIGPVQVLKEDGNLYTFGRATEGSLGNGTTTPTINIPFITQTDVTDIFCDGWSSHTYGYRTVVFIKKNDGQIYTVGYNAGSACGIGSTATTITSWTRVLLPWDADIVGMGSFCTSTSGRTVLAYGTDNKVYVWGHNGQRGVSNNTTVHALVPHQISITEDNK